ncbi:MAG: hypothetical protein ABI895_15755 [Deltaproteobacteria bacterium]
MRVPDLLSSGNAADVGGMGGRRLTRRMVLLALATFLIKESAQADELSVPIELQVNLLARVVRFERSYAARGGAPALVVVYGFVGLRYDFGSGAARE